MPKHIPDPGPPPMTHGNPDFSPVPDWVRDAPRVPAPKDHPSDIGKP